MNISYFIKLYPWREKIIMTIINEECCIQKKYPG